MTKRPSRSRRGARRSHRADRPAAARRRGIPCSRTEGSQALEMSVRNGPAMMQLTRTVGPKACREALGERVEAGLGGVVGQHGRAGANGSGARDVDDGSTIRAGSHSRADERRETKRPLQIDAQHLVPQLLGHRTPNRGIPTRVGALNESLLQLCGWQDLCYTAYRGLVIGPFVLHVAWRDRTALRVSQGLLRSTPNRAPRRGRVGKCVIG